VCQHNDIFLLTIIGEAINDNWESLEGGLLSDGFNLRWGHGLRLLTYSGPTGKLSDAASCIRHVPQGTPSSRDNSEHPDPPGQGVRLFEFGPGSNRSLWAPLQSCPTLQRPGLGGLLV
jgi:hypothetical protein